MQNCEDNMLGLIVPTIIINFVGTAFLMGMFRIWDRANAITFVQDARRAFEEVTDEDVIEAVRADTSAKPVDTVDTAEITVEVELPKNLQGVLNLVGSDGSVRGVSMRKLTAIARDLLNSRDSESEYLVKTVDRLRG